MLAKTLFVPLSCMRNSRTHCLKMLNVLASELNSLLGTYQQLVLQHLRDALLYHGNHRITILLLAIKLAPTWLPDSGASHHTTSDLSNLLLHIPYEGFDDVMIGNGSPLHITHAGSITMPTPSRYFLYEMFFVFPQWKESNFYIYQFCITNQVSIEFSPIAFQVKDLHMWTKWWHI